MTPSCGHELGPSMHTTTLAHPLSYFLRQRQGRHRLTRLRRNINPILRTPRNMKMIINLIQLITRTLDTSINASPKGTQRMLNLRTSIILRRARHDTRNSEECVSIERFEEVDGFLEEIHHLFLRCIIDIAVRIETRDTRPMLPPLVFPERFVVAAVVFPVSLHVRQ